MPDSLRRGAFFAVSATFLFACMGAFIKFASSELGNMTIVFLRNLIGWLVLLPVMARRSPGRLHTRRLPLHMFRAAVGLTAMYCFFFAIAHMPIAEAMLLNYASPLWIPVIAWFWLGEKPDPRLYPIIAIGIIGIALVLKPSTGSLLHGAGLVAVCAGIFAAWAFVSIRRLSSSEPSVRIVFYFTSMSLVISALPMAWLWTAPSPRAWLLMLGAGACATAGQLCLTRAYSAAPAANIAPFNYMVVVFAGLVGWAFWHESPDIYSAIGMLVVIGTSVASARLRS